jgi:hypothetical protein
MLQPPFSDPERMDTKINKSEDFSSPATQFGGVASLAILPTPSK